MSRRRSNVRQYSAEDQALTDISKEAENRLAVKRAVRTEAREIRMKEIERQEKEAEEKERLGSDYGSAKSRQQHSVASAASSRRGSDSSEGTNDSMSSNARNLKMELRTLEEKYKAAMMTSAQLDNERQSLVYQVELFKDQLEELTESQTELQREYKDKNRNLELTKRELQAAQLEVKGLREQNEHKDRLIAESGFVIVAAENGELSLERSDEPPSANGPIGTGGLLLSSESLVLLNKGREGSLGMHSLDSFNSAAHTTQAASGTGLAQPPSHTQAEESQSQSLVQASENVTTSGQNEEGSSVDGPVFQKSSKDRETGADSSLGKADQAETGVCAEAVEALSEQPGTAVSHSPDGKESKKSVPEAGGNMPVGNDDAGSVTSLPSEVVEDHISVLVTSHEGMGNESAEKSSDGMLTQLHGQESDCCKDKGRKVLDGAGVSEQNSAESPDTEGGDQIDSSSDASQSLTGSKSHSENSQSDLPSVVVTQCSHRSQDSEDDDVEFFDAVSTPLPSPRDAEFKYEETGADTQGQAAEAVSSEYSEVSGEDGKEVDGHVRGFGEDGKIGEEDGKEEVEEGGKEVEEGGKEVDGHDVREGAGEDGKVGEEDGKVVEEHDVREGLGEDGKIGEEDGKVVEEGGKEVDGHDVREGAGEDGKVGEEDGKEVEEHDVREGAGEDGKVGEEGGKEVEEHDVREGAGEDGKVGEEDGKEVGGKEDKEADAEEDKDISEKDEKEVDGDDVKQVDEAADGQVVKEDIERVEGSEVTADNKILEVEGEGPHTDVEDSRSEGQEAHSEELERKANKSGTDDLTEMNESNQKPSESPSSDVKTCVGESAEQDDDSVGESMNVEKVSERVDGNVSVDACEAGGTGSEDNILQQTVGGASEEISEMLQHAQGTEQMPVGDTDAHTDDSGHVCREEINEKEEMEKALCDSKEDETSASPDEGHPAPSDNEPVDRQSSSQRETELDECHEESVSEPDSVQARPLSEAETDDSVPTEPQNIKPSLEDGEDNDLKSKETGTDHWQTEPAHGEDTSKMEAEDIVKDHKEGSADKGGNEESEEVPDTLSPMLDSKPINREISEEGTSEDSEAQLGDDAYDFDDIDAVLDEGSPVTSKGKGGEQNVDGDSEDKVSFGSKDSGLQSESFTNKDSEASKEDTVSFGSRDSGLQENAPVKDRETGSGETVSMRSRDSGAGIEDMSSQDGSGGKSAAGAEVGAVGGASKPHSPVAGSRESLDLEAKLDKMVSQGSASKATPSKEKHGHKKSKFKMFKNIFK